MVTWEELRQAVSETWGKVLREYKEDLRRMDQHLASPEHDARQPRPAMEADVLADERTRERTEGATKYFKRYMRIAFLQKGSKTARPPRPVSA